MRAPASFFSHRKPHTVVPSSTREDLQEFRSRAAASGASRFPPTSQIAVKEKEDSLFVPGASKQMNILSRLGIKVSRSRLATVLLAHPSPARGRARIRLTPQPPPLPKRARHPTLLAMRILSAVLVRK
jgi:hypothetical protein